MYASKISLAIKYNYLEEKFVKAYQWLEKTDIAALEAGAYPICEGVTANVQIYRTMEPDSARFEAHDENFDIQYMVSGVEMFGICNREGLVVLNADPSNDITFYEEPEYSGSIVLAAGDFVVVAPEDAHKPRCIAKQVSDVKKVVVKVKL